MTSISKQISIYEKRKDEAERKCKNIAARLRLEKNKNLKHLFKHFKKLMNTSQQFIDSKKALLKEAEDEPIEELKSFLGILIGYIKLHIQTYGSQKVTEGIPYDTVQEKEDCEHVLSLVEGGELGTAALELKYLNCVAFRDKLDELAMYYHSTNWFQSKYYYYHILLNRA